ncbi:hypothetical protein [Methylocella sp.]|jgi:hypothetical protein|uniref:hypothetical protein n=1 Tax=Methylocella sp. TaxID=1978226 RepID=UPI003C259FF9
MAIFPRLQINGYRKTTSLTTLPAPRVLNNEEWPPNYTEVYAWRQKQILLLRAKPELLIGLKHYYATRPVEWINHWLTTFDPRLAAGDRPPQMPLILFTRQAEMVEFIYGCLKNDTSGLIEESRDMGATWLGCAFSVWLWLFMPGASIGWGSRLIELVDIIGNPDSIFEKMRMLIRDLPSEFMPAGFNPDKHMSFMRIINPENGSSITGGGGDNIGRGGRKLIFFKDESAHYLHPEMIEAALSATSRVQIDISSVHGLGNVFHRRRESGIDWNFGAPFVKGTTNVFVMDWRDHPEKDEAWFNELRADYISRGLQAEFAQEVERNYAASVEGVIIPAEWVRAAVDAHIKLQILDSGPWIAGLDVADEGGDRTPSPSARALCSWALKNGASADRLPGLRLGRGRRDQEGTLRLLSLHRLCR